MRNRIAATVLTAVVGLSGLGAVSAFADPSFGPGAGNGNGNNEPHDQGAKCHPPGQASDRPECK